jgi:putative membrane protein
MRNFFYVLLLLGVMTITGCRSNNASDEVNSNTNNYNSTNDPDASTGGSTSEQINQEANVDDDALTFIKTAASSNVMEIEIGKLAQQKAQSQRVKKFGAMMVNDHTKASDELKALASEKNVVVNYSLKPEHKKHIADLQKLSGATFDKHYIQMMLSAHTTDIQLFEQFGADNRDKAVNNFATKTLPILKMHLDSAKSIQADIANK